MTIPSVTATTLAKESADLALFEDVREALQGFTASRYELLWRITHRLRTSDKLRQTIARLLLGSRLGAFQSRADDCACRYEDLRTKRDFPKYDNPIDVLYSLHVPSRAAKWDEERRTAQH
jgi:hypothetical protein